MTAPDAGRGIGTGITGTSGFSRGSFRILHVSTGNVCRSPITERLTRHALADRLGDPLWGGLIVESAGTWGHEGAPMEANAETVLADFGADPSGFVGRELLDDHVIRADLVLTATRDHRAQVISMGHSAGLRTFTLKEFTRLVRAIDPATLPPLEDGVIERACAGAGRCRSTRVAPGPHGGSGRGVRPVRGAAAVLPVDRGRDQRGPGSGGDRADRGACAGLEATAGL